MGCHTQKGVWSPEGTGWLIGDPQAGNPVRFVDKPLGEVFEMLGTPAVECLEPCASCCVFLPLYPFTLLQAAPDNLAMKIPSIF